MPRTAELPDPETKIRPVSQRAFSLAWEDIESLRADGIEDLLIEDWLAIETDKDRIFYDPDWERIRSLEKQGWFHCLAARDRKRAIVGYSAFYVMPMIHSKKSRQAVNDLIWALPEWRGRIGLALIREAERYLKALGAIRITYATKQHLGLVDRTIGGRLDAVLRHLGYSHHETVRAKLL